MRTERSTVADPLTTKTIYEYGLGEFGITFFNSLVAYYLLFFLTDILCLPIKLAAILYAVVQWFEALSSIVCGTVIDRTESKYGKYRVWLFAGSILCFVGTAVFFTKFRLGVAGSATVFTFFYLVSYTGYNCIWIAYRSLTGIIGKNSLQTVSLTISGTQLSTISSLIFSYAGTKLLNAFPDPATGYSVSAVLYGLIIFGCMFLVAKSAKPYDMYDRNEGYCFREKKTSFKELLGSLVGPMIPFSVAFILRLAANTILFSCIIYYFKYVMNNERFMSIFIIEMTLVRFFATFIVKPIARRFDKKGIYIVSVLLASVFIILAFFFSKNTAVFFVLIGLYNFFLLPGGIMFVPFMSDITDYNQYSRGINVRSFIYSVGSGFVYIAQFLGAIVSSYGLVWIGYKPAALAQPESVLEGISLMTLIGTATFTVLSVIPMFFYKLDNSTMQRVYALKR